MSRKNDYISQMVADTFAGIEEIGLEKNGIEQTDNVLAFPTAATPLAGQAEMSFDAFSATYDPSRHCLRFCLFGIALEAPANWGPFQGVDFASDFSLELRSDTDRWNFLAVLEALTGRPVERLSFWSVLGRSGCDVCLAADSSDPAAKLKAAA